MNRLFAFNTIPDVYAGMGGGLTSRFLMEGGDATTAHGVVRTAARAVVSGGLGFGLQKFFSTYPAALPAQLKPYELIVIGGGIALIYGRVPMISGLLNQVEDKLTNLVHEE